MEGSTEPGGFGLVCAYIEAKRHVGFGIIIED